MSEIKGGQVATMNETSASGEEIYAIVQEMEPALINKPIAHGIIAALSIALTLMHPDLTPEELSDGVRGCSEWICMFLSTAEAKREGLVELVN